MPYYGNPHLDEYLSETQGNPHGDYTSITPALLAGQRLLNAMANKPQTIVHSGKEEEERERLRKQLSQYRRRLMQARQSRYSRPNTIPESLWKAYVPDEGMSNYSIWDDRGGYEGLDVGGLLEAISVRTKVDPITGKEF